MHFIDAKAIMLLELLSWHWNDYETELTVIHESIYLYVWRVSFIEFVNLMTIVVENVESSVTLSRVDYKPMDLFKF